MKALIIVAHGSKRVESNNEIKELIQKIKTLAKTKQNFNFDYINYAFLELAEPNIPDAIITQIKNGATKIIVLPYFLSKGRHVTIDIPNEVAIAKKQYPKIAITITNYLGASDEICNLIMDETCNF